ncbi:hypothetical protein NDU88_003635 [Pleurodeles waltl]|uniref:Uncharacterized protein n=1 Tax=Pleurodeles waltl TaxID=8319 RepID=A0AAV7KVH8_PLEWA|nr:hypothetical protein NDU88_003635 [Pleurodeles waltl]
MCGGVVAPPGQIPEKVRGTVGGEELRCRRAGGAAQMGGHWPAPVIGQEVSSDRSGSGPQAQGPAPVSRVVKGVRLGERRSQGCC